MKRGTIVILIMLVVAFAAAGVSLVYHYRNQYRAQEYWGTTTALLIDRAPQVELLLLGEPGRDIALEDDAISQPEPAEKPGNPDVPATQAVEFNEQTWMVVKDKDAKDAKGVANLRRALVLDTTFDWSEPPAGETPHWQFAISTSDGQNWATVLFDFESRQVGLTGGRRTVRLNPEANEDFRQFFAEQFPDAPVENQPAEQPAEPVDEPSEPSAETGG